MIQCRLGSSRASPFHRLWTRVLCPSLCPCSYSQGLRQSTSLRKHFHMNAQKHKLRKQQVRKDVPQQEMGEGQVDCDKIMFFSMLRASVHIDEVLKSIRLYWFDGRLIWTFSPQWRLYLESSCGKTIRISPGSINPWSATKIPQRNLVEFTCVNGWSYAARILLAFPALAFPRPPWPSTRQTLMLLGNRCFGFPKANQVPFLAG